MILRHRFPDARYRLADDVLQYGTAKPGATKFAKGSVGAFDDALPEALFRAVGALAPDGALWPARLRRRDERLLLLRARAGRGRRRRRGGAALLERLVWAGRPSRRRRVSSGGRTAGRTAPGISSTSTRRTRAPERMGPSILYVLSYFICRRLGSAGRRS